MDGPQSIGWLADDTVNQTAYFEFKGLRTPDVVNVIRTQFDPDCHNVSRADVCEDYDQSGAYRRLINLIDACKGDARVRSEAIVPRDGDRGETTYWGSTSSALRIRCYEKGKQKENLHLDRPDWARVELQCRPSKSVHKTLAAALPPEQFWGYGGWTTRVGEALMQTELVRFAPPQEAPTFDRTFLYLAKTFRRFWTEALEDYGDWDCIGREFQAIWAEEDKKAKRGLGQ
jgi:hypothetical protein